MTRKKFVAIFIMLCIAVLVAVLITFASSLERQRLTAIAMKEPPSYLGPLILDISSGHGLEKPIDVASSKNTVYVLDSEDAAVKLFSHDGDFIQETRIESDNEGVKPYPVSMAIDPDSNKLYVAEMRSNRLRVYDRNCQFIGFAPKEDGLIKKPISVAITGGKMFVADAGTQSIKEFEIDSMKKILEFGGEGAEAGRFLFPTGIATKDNGDICVVDSNNKRVQIFDDHGKLIKILRKSHTDCFALPRDVAVDGIGFIHVIDAFSRRVCVFNDRGDFVYSYGDRSQEVSMLLPRSIYIDKKSFKIYVVDQEGQQIYMFGYQ